MYEHASKRVVDNPPAFQRAVVRNSSASRALGRGPLKAGASAAARSLASVGRTPRSSGSHEPSLAGLHASKQNSKLNSKQNSKSGLGESYVELASALCALLARSGSRLPR